MAVCKNSCLSIQLGLPCWASGRASTLRVADLGSLLPLVLDLFPG